MNLQLRTKECSSEKKGFTILESLVSISILAVAVTGPLVYVTNSLKAAEVARDQTIAFYLAQDAVEHIKNVRDDNKNNARGGWLSGMEDCINSNGCIFDRFERITPQTCAAPPAGCEVMRKSGTGETFEGYGYGTGGSWEDSPFTRTVVIEFVEHDVDGYLERNYEEEVKVIVTVAWTTRTVDREVVVTEHIFNVRNAPQYAI